MNIGSTWIGSMVLSVVIVIQLVIAAKIAANQYDDPASAISVMQEEIIQEAKQNIASLKRLEQIIHPPTELSISPASNTELPSVKNQEPKIELDVEKPAVKDMVRSLPLTRNRSVTYQETVTEGSEENIEALNSAKSYLAELYRNIEIKDQDLDKLSEYSQDLTLKQKQEIERDFNVRVNRQEIQPPVTGFHF